MSEASDPHAALQSFEPPPQASEEWSQLAALYARLNDAGLAWPADMELARSWYLPHLERLHYLREYLARARRKPQLVLFEIAGGYDSGPLYQVHQMRFTDRMVAAMDGSSA